MKLHTPGLAGRLALVTVLLVTLAVTAVSGYAIGTLRDLAAAGAFARAEAAAAAARETIRQSTEDLLTAARVLGERPTLQRLLQGDRDDGIAPYLARYCDGAGLDGCAVQRNGRLITTGDEAIAWEQVLSSAVEQGERFLATGAAPGVALAGARASAADRGDVTVLTVRLMDDAFAARLSERAGMQIRVLDYSSLDPGAGPFGVLNSDALASGTPVAAYVPEADTYAASVPVAASTGEVVALVHALLPAAQVMDPVDTMARRILVAAALVAVLATGAGILIGRQWIAGVQRLTRAAQRIGSGDLADSIPAEGGKELGVLAQTMEEMRRSLIELTSELRRREADAQAVLGGIVEGVYAVDGERRIRFLNSQAEKLLGVTAEDAMGRFCGDVLRPQRDAEGRRPCEHACPILHARRSGAAQAMERIEPTDGRVRRVVIASAAPNEGMQVLVLRDETELEAVRRTRDTVLANISHEFRTPLAAQLASIELLRDGLGTMPPEQQRELVSSLERGVQRLTWLIDNLLESVRIESGQLAIRRQDVTLRALLDAAEELVGPLLAQRGQRLEVEPVDHVPRFRGDRQRLTQVVVNLLANASKFSPPGGAIRVGAGAAGGHVTFWVDDEGPGPKDADTAALFERFRRSGGEDPEESGLGLGLYIVRSIVERHGGRVTLLRTEDAKTRAQVEIPLQMDVAA
ncbi:MAG TPA: ATP-binding protein [Gammaproteobacteria bacterium]